MAKSLSSPQARDRPPGYPLFLSLAEGVGGTAWPHAVVLAQMALLAGIASSLFGISSWIHPPNRAAVAAVFCSVTPGLIGLTSCMLPEILLAFLLTLCWSRSLHLVTETRPFGRDLVASAVACGALSGAAALVKPVWVLGILPLAAGVALGRRKTSSSWAGLAVLMIAAHVALVGSWQIFLAREFGQWKPSAVGTTVVLGDPRRDDRERGGESAVSVSGTNRSSGGGAEAAMAGLRTLHGNQGRHSLGRADGPGLRSSGSAKGSRRVRSAAAPKAANLLHCQSSAFRPERIFGNASVFARALRSVLCGRFSHRDRRLARIGTCDSHRSRLGSQRAFGTIASNRVDGCPGRGTRWW